MSLPILYSYRRCPYAMRARMALRYAGIEVEIREIALRDKPQHMLAVSPKGTVPVLVLDNGEGLDESLDIMAWALAHNDRDGWLTSDPLCSELIAENDGSFKRALDQYKYAIRFPEQPAETYRQQGEIFLARLEALLAHHSCLLGEKITQADIAIFPFIRQFSMVDAEWFASSPYPRLRNWLTGLMASDLFVSVMQKHPTWTGNKLAE
jgi:glutathione S-transferase